MNSKYQDKTISRFRLKLAALFVLKHSLAFITAWGFLWGTIVLVSRITMGTLDFSLLWGVIGALLAIGIAVVLALRQIPTRSSVRALFDKQNGYGGLLMASEDIDLGSWQERMTPITVPRLHWDGSRLWILFTASAFFVVISFLIPSRYVTLNPDRPLKIGTEVNKLAEQIELLKAEEIIEHSKAEAFEKKLDQLSTEASGEDPVKTLEALDHLEEALAKVAQKAGEEALGIMEHLTKAQALAESLKENAEDMNPKLMTEAMEELSRMMQEATIRDQLSAISGRDWTVVLTEQALDALKSSSLSPEQLEEISLALQQAKGNLTHRLVKLREAGMIDLELYRMYKKLEDYDISGLVAFLEQDAKNLSISEILDLWLVGEPGKGGLTRGRGDAPMTWSDGTTEEGAKFKEQTLPPAAVEALKDNLLVGMSVEAPSVEVTDDLPGPGALNDSTAGGGAAFTQTILPRHRGTVKRYFER